MKRTICIIFAGLLLGGCASIPPDERVAHDPWESPNRKLFQLNEAVDKVSLKPIAKGYRWLLPEPVRKGVTNFFRNLGTPRSAINNFLQGKPKYGFQELARLAVNSTVGIGGLVDIATHGGLEAHPEDFGQTAAVWGVPPGPFVMIPFLGPATLRGAVLLPLNIATSPLYHYNVSSVRDRLYGLRLIDIRARVLPLEDLMKDSTDPYVTLRESFLQNVEFQVYDGNPPASEEDDDLFDEFLEEEDY
jgi:phospholipid-binding lipoprotein MlaA